MPTVQELQARLDTLQKHRAGGALSLEVGGKRITYKSDADMASAAADLERQIAALTTTPVTTIRVAATKGLDTA